MWLSLGQRIVMAVRQGRAASAASIWQSRWRLNDRETVLVAKENDL